MSTATERRDAAPSGAKPYLSYSEAAQYLRDLGFADVTERTIKYHSTETGKLPKPKVVTGRCYWHRADLDKLVESL
ncbi:DNA-binding protein [Mycobacteroides abscessus]|uniref:DNA-binding protein n=1 Tax=Mycobacteroides abscessus TaxID=36809 RepID=UPI001F3238D4|nr:DNA-binding protein [Mycobacteroides abscessus]